MRYAIISFILILLGCADNKSIYQKIDQDFCSQIHRDTSTTLSEQLQPVEKLMQQKTGVYPLEEGDMAMVARAWLCEYAEQTIDVQYFIFTMDNVGIIAVDYLLRAADRGVKVRILIDDLLVDADADDIIELDAHKNITIKIYNPTANIGKNISEKIVNLVTDFRGVNQRMHNKTFIVDNKVVITGGRNIADEYFDYDHEYNFRDRDVLLLGGITGEVVQTFNTFWEDTLSRPIKELVDERDLKFDPQETYEWLHQYACNPENFWPQVREKIRNIPHGFKAIQESGDLRWIDSIYFVSDIPGKNETSRGLKGGGVSTSTLINLVKNAEKTIVIQSPYLVTTKLGQGLFRDAVKRGVRVRILTNSMGSTDGLEAFSGYQRQRETLLKTGIRIYEYRPDAAIRYKMMTGALQKELDFKPIFGLHAKSMVIDRNISIIGTFNLDPRSANLNTECVVIIHSKEIARQLLTIMEEEFKPENSWETTLEFNPDSEAGWWRRFKVWIRRFIPVAIL